MISLGDQLDILEQLLRSLEAEDDNSPDLQRGRSAPKPWWALLPEETRYRDTGCELSPSCLNCPLPRCVEDTPRGKQRLRQCKRADAINSLVAQGHTQVQIAQLLGVSARTIRRYRNASACRQLSQNVTETAHFSPRRTR